MVNSREKNYAYIRICMTPYTLMLNLILVMSNPLATGYSSWRLWRSCRCYLRVWKPPLHISLQMCIKRAYWSDSVQIACLKILGFIGQQASMLHYSVFVRIWVQFCHKNVIRLVCLTRVYAVIAAHEWGNWYKLDFEHFRNMQFYIFENSRYSRSCRCCGIL